MKQYTPQRAFLPYVVSGIGKEILRIYDIGEGG